MTHRGRSVWLASIIVATSAIALALWQMGFNLIPVAFTAESRLSEFQTVSSERLSLADSEGLEGLYKRVSQTSREVEPAIEAAMWAGRFSLAVSWLPMARQELSAWGNQARRLQNDLDAASTILKSSSQLVETYGEAQEMIAAPGASPSSIRLLKAQAADLDGSFDHSVHVISDNPRRATGMVFLLPHFRDLDSQLGRLENRMTTVASAGNHVSELMVELLEVAEGAHIIMGQLGAEAKTPERTTHKQLQASLVSVSAHSVSARQKAEDVVRLLSETGQADQLIPQLEVLEQTLDVLHTVSSAAAVGLEALEPAAKLAEHSKDGLLSDGNGLIDVFESVSARGEQISNAIEQLEKAEQTITDIANEKDEGTFGSGLAKMSAVVRDLRAALQLINSIAPLGDKILGSDGAKRYLVLGQSADELRGTGGFVSSVWLVTFEGGALSNIQYHDAVRVDDWEHLDLYPKGPPGLEKHMNAWVWLLRDVSWDPDFPTTARAAEDLFRLGQRKDVDGVIAINQWTLLRLIDALGTVPSPVGADPVTSRNLLATLEQGTDQHGRAYMDLVLQGLMERLDQPMSLATLIEVASALNDTLRTRDMMVYFDDPEVQSVFALNGWDGSIRQDSRDYLYVVDANVGWSKVDRNIQREVSYTVDLRKRPRPRASVTLGYTNLSGPGSSGCEPQWLSRGKDYSQLKNACYWNLFRVYTPQGTRLLSHSALPLPEHSVAVDTGKAQPGEDTLEISSSHYKTVFSGVITLEAGERREISLVYDLPEAVSRLHDGNLEYELLIQKQPGVRHRRVSVDLIPPEGFGFASASVPPSLVEKSRVEFVLDLREDVTLSVSFDKGVDGSR